MNFTMDHKLCIWKELDALESPYPCRFDSPMLRQIYKYSSPIFITLKKAKFCIILINNSM